MINRLLSMLFLFLTIAQSFATAAPGLRVELIRAESQAGASIGVGSRIQIDSGSGQAPHTGWFLGELISANGRREQMMLIDEKLKKVFFIDREAVSAPRGEYQRIVRPYDQVDGTCTGYAMDHMMEQIARNRLAGNAALQAQFASEKGRTQFLVRAINDYYISTVHRTSIHGILKKYGEEFGLRCGVKKFTDPARAMSHVVERVLAGIPVLVSFDIGPNMHEADLPLYDLSRAQRTPLDGRLWLPRKIGERNSGGHSVVAVAAFEALGKRRLLMLDSDWAEPRIWDLEQALGGRTDIDAVEFHSCN
jgi:hypothetical protein